MSRILILDTNVVLDWLVFLNPHCAGLDEALTERRLRWIGSPRMRSEIEYVLSPELCRPWRAEREQVLARIERWLEPLADEAPPAPEQLRCSDPDDQMFVDLAWAQGPCLLLTRDKALLALARRCAGRGVCIVTPEHWPTLPSSDAAQGRLAAG